MHPRRVSLRLGDRKGWLRAATLGCALAACTPPPVRASRPPPASAAPKTIEFIEDDFPRALAAAKAKRRPLVIDAWASWCHSCLSMRAYVFGDPALAAAVGDRYVWASIDTEKEGNAAFLAEHPVEAWPTIFVLQADPTATLLKWPGTATSAELLLLLDEVTAGGGAGAGEATTGLLQGDRAAAEARYDDAARSYQAALAAARPDWSRRARAVEALVGVLHAAKRDGECVEVAVAELPDLPANTSRATIALEALGCGEALPKKAPERVDVPVIADIVARIANDRGQPLLADDRSSLYEALVDWRTGHGDAAGAKLAAQAWASFLEEQAAHAATKQARAVFDAHRLLAYLALGEPDRAVAMLTESERDFPDDYNPPARLARVYFETRKLEPAQEAIERALSKAYGPRTLRLVALQADILVAAGKRPAARAALERVLDKAKGWALTGSYAKLADQLRARASTL